MKGTLQKRRFIAIKLKAVNNTESTKKKSSSQTKTARAIDQQKYAVLVLTQDFYDGTINPLIPNAQFAWTQLDKFSATGPRFFDTNFTLARDGSGPPTHEKKGFIQVQTLLKTGQAEDVNGHIWKIKP